MSRKAAASEGWLQKAAEEADLIVDGEDDSDEEFYQVVQSNLTLTLVKDVHLLQGLQTGKNGSGVSTKQQVVVARAALNSLLNTPLDQVKARSAPNRKKTRSTHFVGYRLVIAGPIPPWVVSYLGRCWLQRKKMLSRVWKPPFPHLKPF